MSERLNPFESHDYPGLERFMLETLERVKDGLPPDCGAAVFVFHYGQGGGLAYGSTCERSDMINTVIEWLWRQVTDGRMAEVQAAIERHFKPRGG